MSQAGGQPGREASDQELLKLTIFGVITVFIIIGILYSQERRVNAVVGAITWLHVLPFAMIVKYVPIVLDIPFLGRWLFEISALAHDYLLDGGYSEMRGEVRNSVLVAGGRAAAVIYGFIFGWIAFFGREFRVDQRYRTRHSLESMIWLQSDIWMTSRISRHNNPLKGKELSVRRLAQALNKNIESAPKMPGSALPRRIISILPASWNRAMRPEEWLLANGLAFDKALFMNLDAKITEDEGIDKEFKVIFNAKETDFEFRAEWEKLDLETVSEVLASQLRTPWTRASDLRPCHKAVFCVMALFYNYEVDAGNALLSDLGIVADAVKANRGKMDDAISEEDGLLARIDKIVKSEAGIKLARLARNHAYVESAFPTFLAASRKDRGVLPPAAFLWLKSQDRLMWYILNNVGNEAVMIEASGALAHSRAEAQIQKRIRRPAVYQAARALIEDYLDLMPERLASRKEKAVRARSPGEQMDLIHKAISPPPKAPDLDWAEQ